MSVRFLRDFFSAFGLVAESLIAALSRNALIPLLVRRRNAEMPPIPSAHRFAQFIHESLGLGGPAEFVIWLANEPASRFNKRTSALS